MWSVDILLFGGLVGLSILLTSFQNSYGVLVATKLGVSDLMSELYKGSRQSGYTGLMRIYMS
jgi:hypothetical protein